MRSVPKPRPPEHLRPLYTRDRNARPGASLGPRPLKGGFQGAQLAAPGAGEGKLETAGGREADGVGVRVSRAAGGPRAGGAGRGGAGPRGGGPRTPGAGPEGAAPGVQPARKRAGGSPGAQSARSRREGRRYARRGRGAGSTRSAAGTGPKAARVPSAPCTALRCPPRCELLGRKDCSQGRRVGCSSSDPVSPLTLASLTPLGAIGRPLPGTPPHTW